MDTFFSLPALGWNPFFQEVFTPYHSQGLVPARVMAEHKDRYVLAGEAGTWTGEISGRLQFTVEEPADLPKTGDWVAIFPFDKGQAIIHAVLPRKTRISRREAGKKAAEQVIATNVDLLLIVMALDANYNLRRLERYLALAWDGGARPVVLLNKSDLAAAPQVQLAEVKEVAGEAVVLLLSASLGQGIGQLREYIQAGETAAVVGSSGVGKSTLINQLLGNERQATQAVRETDAKGRHTTTHRELFVLPSGGILIDTPGMRELQLWQAGAGLASAFSEIEALAVGCRFADCSHTHENGCAVVAALDTGELDAARYQAYLKLLREQAYQETLEDPQKMLEKKQKWKKIHKELRKMYKKK